MIAMTDFSIQFYKTLNTVSSSTTSFCVSYTSNTFRVALT